MRSPPGIGFVGCILAFSLADGGITAAPPLDEYYVKAGIVANFASFVEWPADAFRNPREPLRVCVLGRNPFGTSLGELAEGRIVDGHPLAVLPVVDLRQAEGCHILFVGASEHLRLKSILDGLGQESVLSVGDTSDFIAEGGIVSLRVEDGKVRMEINAEAAKAKRLRISSRLLQLARNAKR